MVNQPTEAKRLHIQKQNTLSKIRSNGKSWKAKHLHKVSKFTRNKSNGKAGGTSWAVKQKEKLDRKQFVLAKAELKEINDNAKKEKRLQMEEKKRQKEANELQNQLKQNGGSGKTKAQNARLAKRLKKASEKKLKKMQKKQAQML